MTLEEGNFWSRFCSICVGNGLLDLRHFDVRYGRTSGRRLRKRLKTCRECNLQIRVRHDGIHDSQHVLDGIATEINVEIHIFLNGSIQSWFLHFLDQQYVVGTFVE